MIAAVIWVAQGQLAAMRGLSRRLPRTGRPAAGEQAQPQPPGLPDPGGAVEGEHLPYKVRWKTGHRLWKEGFRKAALALRAQRPGRLNLSSRAAATA